MQKSLYQGAILIVLFFSSWLLLKQVDWITIFKVEKATDKTEEKLGDLLWDIFKKSESENTNPYVASSIDSIVDKICSKNNIDKQKVKVKVINKDEVNAFALPNGYLLINSGLILASDNPEELSGVISHELAHIQLNHVMKKLIKEVGLTIIISMATGNGGNDILQETAKLLSSTAFDRGLEKEADIKAVDYLINAEINPEPLAHFFYKLSDKEHEALKYLSWISTHPNSKERAEYIVEYSKDKPKVFKAIFADETWAKLKDKLKRQD